MTYAGHPAPTGRPRIVDLRSDTVTQPSEAMRGPWRVRPSATTSMPRIRRSTRSRSGPPTCSARRGRSSAPRARWATSARCSRGCRAAARSSAGRHSHTLAGEAGRVRGARGRVGARARTRAGRAPRPGGDRRRVPRPVQDVHEPISSLVTIENTVNASGGLPLDRRLHGAGGSRRPRARRPAAPRRGAAVQRGGGAGRAGGRALRGRSTR